jgi:hypothetical protein
MNNNIEEKLVSFEAAKLLKGKGFDVKCEWAYQDNKLVHDSKYKELKNWNEVKYVECSAPTQQLAIDWIHKNYNIWIIVTPLTYSDNITHWRWEHVSTKYETRNLKWKKEKDFISPEEAKEDAIIYVLETLI